MIDAGTCQIYARGREVVIVCDGIAYTVRGAFVPGKRLNVGRMLCDIAIHAHMINQAMQINEACAPSEVRGWSYGGADMPQASKALKSSAGGV